MQFLSSLSGFEVKQLDVGSINGASVVGRGLVLNDDAGPSGDFSLDVKAKDVSGLLQLMGIAKAAQQSVSALKIGQALGATDAQIKLAIQPSEQGPIVRFDSAGKSQDIKFSSQGTAKGIESANTTWIDVDGQIAGSNSAALACTK